MTENFFSILVIGAIITSFEVLHASVSKSFEMILRFETTCQLSLTSTALIICTMSVNSLSDIFSSTSNEKRIMVTKWRGVSTSFPRPGSSQLAWGRTGGAFHRGLGGTGGGSSASTERTFTKLSLSRRKSAGFANAFNIL